MSVNQNREKYLSFRKKYPDFVYSGYRWDIKENILKIQYDFEITGLAAFSPTWEFCVPEVRSGTDKTKLDTLIFSLGLVESISYWKICCSEHINIKCGSLDAWQVEWWKKLYRLGLGEFFWTNGIVPDEINIIPENTASPSPKECEILRKDSVLVPIGGGKDSAVSLELLRGYKRYGYIINSRGATDETVEVSGIGRENTVLVRRTLDPEMLRLNGEGFLNGHTPFSALVAFSSVITAYLCGIGYVVLSNESSANEPTVQGSEVNHQYSKSLEFESDFAEYEKYTSNCGVYYFSLLRPLSEIGIARLFSAYGKYHEIFKSCNRGSKGNIWCAACPKCLFVYIILSPFLEKEKLVKIFGKDMLDSPDMTDILDELVGAAPTKPFECVGEISEVNAAMQRLLEKEPDTDRSLMVHYKSLGIKEKYDLDEICTSLDANNRVPKKFMPLIADEMRKMVND